jgi:tetratricopeptide (TPR) repeat protein
MSIDSQQSRLDVQQVQGVFSLYSTGQFSEALNAANALLRAHPEEGILFTLAGLIHAALLQYEPAIEKLRRAIEIRPDVPDSYHFLGNTLLQKGDTSEALEYFERAIELRPDYLEAHNKLCEGLERSNRLEELEQALARAKEHCPGAHPALALREAELLKRRGDFEDARARLEGSAWQAADDDTRETAAYLLADLCDRLDAPDEAFSYAEEGNRITRASLAAQRTDPDVYFQLVDRLTGTFTDLDDSDWKVADVDDGRADPVFIVGFPRSGTTLLNTILQTHGNVQVLEEVATVYRLESDFLEITGGYSDGLSKLDAAGIERLRQTYFGAVDAHIPAAEHAKKLLVDKLPLNIVHAGLIHRVFPRARFLFVQRHPCDSVLSCYMRNFVLNEAMINCTELTRAAKLYDRVMSLWTLYRETLPLDVHTVRYESLISDFEATLKGCLEFLGLGWEEGIRDYMHTEINRGRLGTPSYNQVTQDLYTEASGRWQRYRPQLEPVLPELLPWAQRMGYSDARVETQ